MTEVQKRRVYTIAECTTILRLSRNSVMKLVFSGKLRAIKAGEKRWLVPSTAIDEFLDSNAV